MIRCAILVLFVGTGLAQDHGAIKVLGKLYAQCENSNEIYKCLKIQALKIADRALKTPNIKLFDGISMVEKQSIHHQRSYQDVSQVDYNSLPTDKVDALLAQKASMFLESHNLEFNVPRVLATSSDADEGRASDEARRKKNKKYRGALLALLTLKGGFLMMAYQSIAIIAGKALLVGKIALILSAIIGLKKLLSSEGHEKTTYEIVKHPQVAQSHTYSSNHGEYEGGEGGGQYPRSLGAEEQDMLMQERAYSAHVPQKHHNRQYFQ